MSDKNFFSITGDDKGAIWVNDVLTYTADQPGIREIDLGEIVPPHGVAWSDCLKLSGVRRLKVRVSVVDGHLCEEDAVDINHCRDIELIIDVLYAGRTYCFTIKGGTRNARIEVRRMINHGRETDFDIGNYSEQNTWAKTTEVMIRVTSLDGTDIKVRRLWASKPILIGKMNEVNGSWYFWIYIIWRWMKLKIAK